MTNRTIEAVLRLSAKLGSLAAFDALGNKLNQVNQKAAAFNRTQTAIGRAQNAANGMLMAGARYLAPAALAYGAIEATKEFAAFERQLTRTGLKIGATKADMTDLGRDSMNLAQRYAVSTSAVLETVDAYAETGATLQDIKSDIDGIVKAQQAMGAQGKDVVNSWDAARRSFGLMSKDSERFFDIMAAGGNSGKFEGSDLATYLPSLMPIAAVNGYSGLSGSAALIGALETMRNRTGTSESAATAVKDFMEKINSPTVERNFAKLGIDLPKALKQMRKDGTPLFEGMSKLLEKATKGDVSKLGHIFSEQDSRAFARLLMTDMPELLKAIDELKNKSQGTIEVNIKAVTENAEASIQHLANSWERFKKSVGAGIAGAGAPGVLDTISGNMDFNGAVNAQLSKEGYTPAERLAWFMRYGFDQEEQGKKAFAAGWRSPAGILAAQGTPDVNPELPSHRQQEEDVTHGGTIPLPTPRPSDLGYPAMPPRLFGRPHELNDVSALPNLPQEPSLMDQAMSAAARASAAELTNAGKEAGSQLGNEFSRMLAGMGKQIGADAAAAFNANVRPVPMVPVGGLPKANGDTGKSTAGRVMGPR